jgi:hypothetical protein
VCTGVVWYPWSLFMRVQNERDPRGSHFIGLLSGCGCLVVLSFSSTVLNSVELWRSILRA